MIVLVESIAIFVYAFPDTKARHCNVTSLLVRFPAPLALGAGEPDNSIACECDAGPNIDPHTMGRFSATCPLSIKYFREMAFASKACQDYYQC